jgi:hypothetical protein
MDFNYLYCNSCGGIVGIYDRENLTCGCCGKQFKLYECDYSELKINDKTGWIFPVRYKFVDELKR